MEGGGATSCGSGGTFPDAEVRGGGGGLRLLPARLTRCLPEHQRLHGQQHLRRRLGSGRTAGLPLCVGTAGGRRRAQIFGINLKVKARAGVLTRVLTRVVWGRRSWIASDGVVDVGDVCEGDRRVTACQSRFLSQSYK